MTISDAQRIRCAVALVALKYKPAEQSLAAYLLDIRRKFPRKTNLVGAPDEPWRERALVLEEEVNSLKRKLESESAELSVLRSKVVAPEQEAPSAASSTTAPKKKKKKSQQNSGEKSMSAPAQGIFAEVQSALKGFEKGRMLPLLGDSMRVLDSYRKLLAVSSIKTRQSETPAFMNGLLKSAADTLRALGVLLGSALQLRPTIKDPLDVINAVDSILQSTLSCVLHALSSTQGGGKGKPSRKHPSPPDFSSPLGGFFGALNLDLLTPILKSLARHSEAVLFSAFQGKVSGKTSRSDTITSTGQNYPDVRPGLLRLLKGLVSMLREHAGLVLPHIGETLDFIVLTAVTEITRLWANGTDPVVPGATPDGERTPTRDKKARLSREERITRLARKDSLWYLCAIIHEVLAYGMPPHSNTSSGPNFSTSGVVRVKIAEALSNLLVRRTSSICPDGGIGSGHGIRNLEELSEVEKGMVMGVIESVWLGDAQTTQ